jgi:hypothetical protein
MITNNLKDMELNGSTSNKTTHINGVPIPKDLLDHLHKHNGGEGYLGERMLYLSKLEEIENLNSDLRIADYLDSVFIFGTYDKDILLGYNAKAKRYCYIHSGYILPEGIYNVSAGFEDFLTFLSKNDIHF